MVSMTILNRNKKKGKGNISINKSLAKRMEDGKVVQDLETAIENCRKTANEKCREMAIEKYRNLSMEYPIGGSLCTPKRSGLGVNPQSWTNS